MALPAAAAATGLRVDTDAVKIHIYPFEFDPKRIDMTYSGVYTCGWAWIRGCHAEFYSPHGGEVNTDEWRDADKPVILSDEDASARHVCAEGMNMVADKLEDESCIFKTVATFKEWLTRCCSDRHPDFIVRICADLDKHFATAPSPALFVTQNNTPELGVYFCDNMPAAIAEIRYVDSVARANNVTYEWI